MLASETNDSPNVVTSTKRLKSVIANESDHALDGVKGNLDLTKKLEPKEQCDEKP